MSNDTTTATVDTAATAETADTKPKNNGRNANGTFALGNLGGPGNPFNRQIAALRKEVVNCCTPERLRRITEKMMDLAEEGDVAAAKLVYTFALGKPAEMPNPDRLDIEEWKLYRETAPMKAETAALGAVGSPAFHLRNVRATRPIIDFLMQEEMNQVANRPVLSPEEKQKREAEEAAACEAFLNQPVPDDDPRVQHLGLSAKSPSTNGGNGHVPPSTNGDIRAVSPSANGGNGKVSPSTNGGNGKVPPSTNGGNGKKMSEEERKREYEALLDMLRDMR